MREVEDVEPRRMRWVRHRHLRQQQSGVHRLGPAWAQHRRQDRPSGDIDTDREFGASHTPVVEQREDVQAGGIDLDLLPGPQSHGRGELTPVVRERSTADAFRRVISWVGELVDKPVERGLRRHRDRVPVPVFQELRDQRHQRLDGALGAPPLPAQYVPDRGDDPLVLTPSTAAVTSLRAAGGAVVDQPPQPLLAVGQPHALHRRPRHPPETQRRQFLRFGLLPLGKRPPIRVVLRPHHSTAPTPPGRPHSTSLMCRCQASAFSRAAAGAVSNSPHRGTA